MKSRRGSSMVAGLILAGVFAAGAVAGAAGGRLWRSDPARAAEPAPAPGHGCAGRSPDELVELFRQRLELDPAQLSRVDPLLRRGWAEIAGVYEGAEPQVARVRTRVRREIRELLGEHQLAMHDALTAELDAKIAAKRRCRKDGIEAASRIWRQR